uniref:Uncharacterized protein n=1 Tax=Bos indicus x Bos taurus TaxID=30522 RepID=A0A4W2BNL3_BOBOX
SRWLLLNHRRGCGTLPPLLDRHECCSSLQQLGTPEFISRSPLSQKFQPLAPDFLFNPYWACAEDTCPLTFSISVLFLVYVAIATGFLTLSLKGLPFCQHCSI